MGGRSSRRRRRATSGPRCSVPPTWAVAGRRRSGRPRSRRRRRVRTAAPSITRFWLTPGHATESGTWYAGTSPHGLFRSDDGGVTWQPVSGLNDDPRYRAWMGGRQDGTPDGPKLHSIIVDPRDPAHLFVGMSSGGVHRSRDGGRTWAPLVKGLEVVENLDPANVTFHDPHVIRLCPADPDRL